MSVARATVAALLDTLVISAIYVLYLQPTAPLSPLTSILIIGVVEMAGFITAWLIATPGFAFWVVKTLVVSAAMAAVITYVLLPSVAIGFDSTFLLLFGVQVTTLIAATFLTKSR